MRRVCTGLEWDKDGDILAIIQDKSGEEKLLNIHAVNDLVRLSNCNVLCTLQELYIFGMQTHIALLNWTLE